MIMEKKINCDWIRNIEVIKEVMSFQLLPTKYAIQNMKNIEVIYLRNRLRPRFL